MPFCFCGFWIWSGKGTLKAGGEGWEVIIPVLVFVVLVAGGKNSRRRCGCLALIVADGIVQDAKSAQRLCLYKLVSFVLCPHGD